MRVGTEHFDQYLKIKKGREQYLLDKSKAGAIGGSISRLSPQQARKNTQAMGLSNIKKPTTMYVLCLKDIKTFRAGQKYTIVMLPGAQMAAPCTIYFKNWVEFLDYFKRFKVQ